MLTAMGWSLFMHGAIIAAVIWFWALRPAELQPMFQTGEFNLAVTVVAEEERGALSATSAAKWPLAPLRGDVVERGAPVGEVEEGEALSVEREAAEEGVEARGASSVESGAPEEGMEERGASSVERRATADAGRRTPDESDRRPWTVDRGLELDDGELMTDDSLEMTENDDLPADLFAVALSNAEIQPKNDAGRRTPDNGQPAALSQGVSGAVPMQSEIRPYYPLGARLRGEEGVVTVRVRVAPSGHACRCEVEHSSGYQALDEAAIDAARRVRYVSTDSGVWRAEAETLLTFRFRLTG